MQRFFLLVVCLCMLWVAACGRKLRFDVPREEVLVEGETTTEALKNILGEPESISTIPEGQIWVYRFTNPREYAVVRLRETRKLYIFVDSTGTVRTVSERLISKPE